MRNNPTNHLHKIKDYDRVEYDWYEEDEPCVYSLFNYVDFDGSIHDPACGGGNIPKIAKKFAYTTSAADIIDRGYGIQCDFMTDINRYDNIVTNPPYDIAEKFILHAIRQTDYKVAVLVRMPFLNGQRRKDTIYDHRLVDQVLILSTRPNVPPHGVEKKGGTIDYCWIIFRGKKLRSRNYKPSTIEWA